MSERAVLPANIETIGEALAFRAARAPDAHALESIDGRTLAYGELLNAIDGVAFRLRELGVSVEDRVALLLPPGLDSAVATLGAMQAAVAAPFTSDATGPELTRDLRRLTPRLIVMHGVTAAAAREVAAALGVPSVTLDEIVTAGATGSVRFEGPRATDAGRTTVILHTSGTTGCPKRVPRSDRALVVGARAMGERIGLVADDVLLLAAALDNIGALGNLLTALVSGGACVIAPRFDPVEFGRWLERHEPTWTFFTPTRLHLLLEAAAAGRTSLPGPRSRLRMVRVGSQPMTSELRDRTERSLRAPIVDAYGLSEAHSLTAHGIDAADRREGSVGRPLAARLRILDGAGEDAPTGRTGEIVVRGPTVMVGYLDDAEATTAAFTPDGWFRTGDLGYVDTDGFLFLTGRVKEQINRGGEQIAPAEIDCVLLDHPAVAEAAAFAVPDPRLGEDVVAAVVLRPGMTATAREFRRFLLDRLAASRAPRRIWFVDALPRTHTGKIQRGELARRWSG